MHDTPKLPDEREQHDACEASQLSNAPAARASFAARSSTSLPVRRAEASPSRVADPSRRRLIRVAGAASAASMFASAAAGLSVRPARAASASSASPPPSPSIDLSKVSLVLGDQAGGVKALVEAAGVLQGAPYAYKWAEFQGAAPLFEAQRAGAVDLAPAGDLPVLAAALGDPTLKVVATILSAATSLGIVVQPRSTVRTVADLKGKTVIVSSARGSISQYQLYGALAQAGLSRHDVTIKFVLPIDAFTAFQSGQIEIWATFDPYFGSAQAVGGRVLRDGTGINSGLRFITASGQAAADPAKRAALSDVLLRFRRAGQWAIDHPDAYAQTYATLTRLPLSTAKLITARAPLKLHGVTPDDIQTLQQVADNAFRDAILPRRIDVAALSDAHLGLPTTA